MSIPIPHNEDPDQTPKPREGTSHRPSDTADEFDASVAELVKQIDCVAPEEPDPASGGLIPLSAGLPARRASLDELDQILDRLELLHESLERSKTAERTGPSYAEKRASVSLFASQVRTRNRREYVVGLSVALSAPMGRVLVIGSALLLCAALWIGAQRFDTPVAAQSEVRVLPPAPMPLPAEAGAQIRDFVVQPTSTPEQPREEPPRADAPKKVRRSVAPKTEKKINAAKLVPNVPVPQKADQSNPAQSQSVATAEPVPPVQNPVLNKIWSQAQEFSAAPPAATQPKAQTAVLAPVPSMKVGAVYPEEARRMGIKGSVELTVYIDDRGKPVRAQVDSGPAPLHAAALECIMQWHFKPTVVNGVAVPATGRYSVQFE